MLTATKKWQNHALKFSDLLQQFSTHDTDFILGCEMGGMCQGVKEAHVDMENVVKSALPYGICKSAGAYFSIHNIQHKCADMVNSGVHALDSGRDVDLHWMLFTVDYRCASRPPDSDMDLRDASQPADSIIGQPGCGFAVGILHIPIPSRGTAPTLAGRRRVLQQALDFMAALHAHRWEKDLPIARLLVGDFNMKLNEAEAATQDTLPPTQCAPFQFHNDFNKWQLTAISTPRWAAPLKTSWCPSG